jgi:hypothetical protein
MASFKALARLGLAADFRDFAQCVVYCKVQFCLGPVRFLSFVCCFILLPHCISLLLLLLSLLGLPS